MKKLSTAVVFATIIFAVACSSSKKVSKSATALAQNNWQLYSIGTSQASASEGGKMPSLSFDAQNMKVSGNAGCNNFTGTFKVDKEKLSFGDVASTKMACPDMVTEGNFLSALSKTATFSMYQEKLVLKDANGTQLMSFDPIKKQ